MSNINRSLSTSLNFLKLMHTSSKKLYDISIDAAKDMYSLTAVEDGYPGKMRDKTKDYNDDTELIVDRIDHEYELFKTCMSDILSNRHDENVIYSLKGFFPYREQYKRLKKEYNLIMLKLEYMKENCKSSKDYVKLIAINNVYRTISRFNTIIIAVYNKLCIIYPEKK